MRKYFSAKLKAQIALEAIKNESTLSEIVQKYEVTQSQIQQWKADLLSKAEIVFSKEEASEVDKKYVEALERKAGQLALEVDFLKKNWSRYQRKNGSK